MKILLAGNAGQLGWELQRLLPPLGDIFAFDRAEIDLADAEQTRAVVRDFRPDVIVNAAAYTAVDGAEKEPEAAFAINARAPGVLAEEAAKLGALMVHYSTDYVFDGSKPEPYTEDDAPNPLGVYGASKLEGEQAVAGSGARHWIFRTSWVYGPRGKNFMLTMLRLAREGKPLRVVADQVGAPTTALMLARATVEALSTQVQALSTQAQAPSTQRQDLGAPSQKQPPSGVYHMTAGGQTSWHGFTCAILREFGFDNPVTPIATADYPTPARRPANSVLDNGKLAKHFGIRLPDWEAGLRDVAAVLKESL